jgi:hypothetical protein
MRWLAWRPMQSGPLIRRQPLPDTKASTQSDPLRRQQLPPNTRSSSADGALCRPLLGARSPHCHWGREQPPGLDRVSTPAPARRVAHARCPSRNARGFSLRSARRMHACCPVRARCRSIAERVVLSTIILARKSAITRIRIELCSASSRLSLRSTLRAATLTAPPRSSRSHLCDGRRSSSSFLR